jgi:hypothetical protein
MKIGSQGRLPFVLGMLVVATAFLVSGTALAQNVDQAAVEKLISMNKKALEDFDTLEFDSAKRTLLEALVAGKKAGLETHPIMARTYVHLGAVYITGLKDRQKGVQSFVRAIEIDPTIRISKAMTAPELEEAFADALKQAKPRAAAPVAAPPPPAPPPPAPVEAPPPKKRAPVMEDESAAPPPKKRAPVMEDESAPPPPKAKVSGSDDDSGEPDLPVHINALDCPTPDEVPPDKSVKLRCAAAANLNLAKVMLMYRLPGSEEFGAVEMERTSKGWFQGKIPKKAASGKSIQFYFEGRNAAGKPVVSNGRSDSPNLILIRDKAEPKRPRRRPRRPRGAPSTPRRTRSTSVTSRRGRASSWAESTSRGSASTHATATGSGGSAWPSAPGLGTPRATASRCARTSTTGTSPAAAGRAWATWRPSWASR